VEGEFCQEYPGETGKLRWWGRGEYRKALTVSDEDLAKDVFLEVDGAMSYASVSVNGTPVGGWPYGYASWSVRLTEALKWGSNEIVVTLDNPEESSRWYPGGGIYRNVRILKADKAGIAYHGIGVSTPYVSASRAEVEISTTLRLAGGFAPDSTKCLVRTSLHKYGSSEVLASAEDVADLIDGAVVSRKLAVDSPKLWSPDTPELYEATVEVCAACSDSHPAFSDSQFAVFGIREAEFRPDGFYLNRERTPLKGVCLHHDAGALGAAWHTDAWVRRLLKLKEMGCNAIRMTHNPPAPELLELCDLMGFLVIDELTDTWTVPKKPAGYAQLFDEWVEKDLVAMINRDRNHPSVIMWSTGNEVGEQGYPDKWAISQRLTDICHREDPTRPTTTGNDNMWAAFQPFASTIDVYGFNYKPHAYKDFRDSHPEQPFYGSETASCISTRGYYLFPVVDEKSKGWLDGAPYQVSSYDLYAPAWASKPDYEWFYEDEVPECAGEFVWTGYDYLGEPTPYNLDPSVLTNFHTEEEKQAAIALFASWGQKVMMEPLPSRSSYFGIMDLAGLPKDRFWLYQAHWAPEARVAHILPHWTWHGREGEPTPVHVYASGAVAELFLNGESLGIRERGPQEYRFRWDEVVYQPGTLSVKVYADRAAYEAGSVLATDEVRTAGEPAKISLQVDYRGDELVYVTASVLDGNGVLVPDAANLLTFSVSGPAEILATDAGDPTSHASFRSPSIKTFAGQASVILRRTGKGKIVVKADSEGLKPAQLSEK
jgi:beta-galactosidase